MAESKFIRRTCDFCKTVQEFDEQGISKSQEVDAQSWIVLVRVFIVGDQPYPVMTYACRDACAQNIISTGMLSMPQQLKDLAAQKQADGSQPMFAGVPIRKNGKRLPGLPDA